MIIRIFACLILIYSVALAAPSANDKSAADSYQRGLQLASQQKWGEAETASREAVKLAPQNATYRTFLGDVLAAQGKLEEADQAWAQGQSLKTDAKTPPVTKTNPITPRNPPTAKTPSLPPGVLPNVPDADEEDGTPIVIDDPDRVFATSRNGVTVTTRPGKSPDTEPDIEPDRETTAKTSITPDEVKNLFQAIAHTDKGRALIRDKKWAEAESEYRAALQLRPEFAEAWRQIGATFMARQNWKEAISAYREAVKIEPKSGIYHADLAYALLQSGDREEALVKAMTARRLKLKEHAVFKALNLTP